MNSNLDICPPLYSAFTYYSSSPSTAGTPLTPASGVYVDTPAALDFYDLCDPNVIGMTPPRAGLQHSVSYTYGTQPDGQFRNGVSQERTTINPAHSYAYMNGLIPPLQIKNDPLAGLPDANNSLLPPMRVPHDDRQYGHGFWVYRDNNPTYQYQHPIYQDRAPVFHPQNQHNLERSNTSTSTDTIYTPSSAGYVYLQPQASGIHPVYSQDWQSAEHNGHIRVNTIASSLLPGEERAPPPLERCASSPSLGYQDDRKWSQSVASPEEQHSEMEPENPPIEVMYITDSEVKQTAEIKRMCYNCGCTEPPSWRKSLLALGKILCNRCGIYERTHYRARPNEPETKVRKAGHPRRSANQGLHVMQEEEESSSATSPYSSSPSQTTPSSAQAQYIPISAPAISAPAQFAYSLPPPLLRANSDHPLLSTSALPERKRQLWNSQLATPTPQGRIQYNPYKPAYVQRRSASYNNTPTIAPRQVPNILGASGSALIWSVGRRHSDGED